jgi:steroid 5-alpha reductase family enzyme
VSLFTVFLLQGALLWIVSLPVQVAMLAPGRVGVLTMIGTAIWGVGLVLESIGDWQLARFKADADNRGEVMDRGLWRYTRHPNYFGGERIGSPPSATSACGGGSSSLPSTGQGSHGRRSGPC